MKYSCDMIEDLLPLYYDGVCSSQSRKTVEEHLEECDNCKKTLERMGHHKIDDHFQEEKESIINHYKKNVKRKMMLAGLSIAAIVLIICFIANVATGKTLDWFFIVLSSLVVFASVTVVPFIKEERKGLWTLGSFAASLVLLLLTCALLSGGSWFFVAAFGTLLGLAVVFLPFVINQIPLEGFALEHKGVVIMAADTLLLYFLIIACGFYSNIEDYWRTSFLITTVAVAFVWILFGIIRYCKFNGFMKAGICTIMFGIFISLISDVITWILDGIFKISLTNANLLLWNTDDLINANLYLLILLAGGAIGTILLLLGLNKKRKIE